MGVPEPDSTPEAPRPQNAALPPAPHFDATPFQPDGGAPFAGIMLTISVAIVSAALLGFIGSMIGQWFYLILIFPLGIGAGVGAAVAFALKQGKVRNPAVGVLAGFLGGVIAMLTMH